METLKELASSVKEYLRDRTTNPVYGAFVAAWLAINFRAVLVAIGGGTPEEKIRYIDQQLYPSKWDGPWYGLALPLLVSTAFVFVSPFVRRWVSLFLRWHDRETMKRILEIDGEIPITKERADALRQSINTERQIRLKEREEFNLRIDELQRQLELAAETSRKPSVLVVPSDEASNPFIPGDPDRLSLLEDDFVGVHEKTASEAAKRGLSRAQAELLWVLRNGDDANLDSLAYGLGYPEHHPVKVLVDQLKGLGLISDLFNSSGVAYKITSAGTQALDGVTRRGFNAATSVDRRRAPNS